MDADSQKYFALLQTAKKTGSPLTREDRLNTLYFVVSNSQNPRLKAAGQKWINLFKKGFCNG